MKAFFSKEEHKMNEEMIKNISKELNVKEEQVKAVLEL